MPALFYRLVPSLYSRVCPVEKKLHTSWLYLQFLGSAFFNEINGFFPQREGKRWVRKWGREENEERMEKEEEGGEREERDRRERAGERGEGERRRNR
jgi:hypothetical protein